MPFEVESCCTAFCGIVDRQVPGYWAKDNSQTLFNCTARCSKCQRRNILVKGRIKDYPPLKTGIKNSQYHNRPVVNWE